MRPLLLICDPTYDYFRSFQRHLTRLEIDTCHVRTGPECLREVQARDPAVLLISSETDFGRLRDVVHGLSNMTNRAPALFFASFKPAWRFSREQGVPIEQCLQRPFDEEAFVLHLRSLCEQSAERESARGERARPKAARYGGPAAPRLSGNAW